MLEHLKSARVFLHTWEEGRSIKSVSCVRLQTRERYIKASVVCARKDILAIFDTRAEFLGTNFVFHGCRYWIPDHNSGGWTLTYKCQVRYNF